jgi:hypothetical protein
MTDTYTPAPVDLTPEVLARWEELATKATEGPWEFFTVRDEIVSLETGTGPHSVIDAYGENTPGWLQVEDTDARFIEESRTAVPALLSGVRSRDARIAELEAELAARDAVIARCLDLLQSWPETQVYKVRDVLSAAPSSVLAARDARVKAEALDLAADQAVVGRDGDIAAAWLRARAAEYREQAE